MIGYLINLFILSWNSVNLFIFMLLVKLLVILKFYKLAKKTWTFCVEWVLLDRNKFNQIVHIAKEFIFLLLFITFVFIISFLVYFLIFFVLEDSFLSLNFYACNKALLFFFIYCFVYVILYEDTELYDILDIDNSNIGSLDYDETDLQWDDLNYEVMEDFEHDPEEPLIDIEEDIDAEAELDNQAEYSYFVAEMQDASDKEDDEGTKDDVLSDLYFYERWLYLSQAFKKKGLLFKETPKIAKSSKINYGFFEFSLLDVSKDLERSEVFQVLSKHQILKPYINDSVLLSLYLREDDLVGLSYLDLTVGRLSLKDLRINYLTSSRDFMFVKQTHREKLTHANLLPLSKNDLLKKSLSYFNTSAFRLSDATDIFSLFEYVPIAHKIKFPSYSNCIDEEIPYVLSLADGIQQSKLYNSDFIDEEIQLQTSVGDALFSFNHTIKERNSLVTDFLDNVLKYMIQLNVEGIAFYTTLVNRYIKSRILFLLLKIWGTRSLNKLENNSLENFFNYKFSIIKDIVLETTPIYVLNCKVTELHLRNDITWSERKILYQVLLSKENKETHFNLQFNFFYNLAFNLRKKRISDYQSLLAGTHLLSESLFLRLFFFIDDFFFWFSFGLPNSLKIFKKNGFINRIFLKSDARFAYPYNEAVKNFFYPFFFGDFRFLHNNYALNSFYQVNNRDSNYFDSTDFYYGCIDLLLSKELDFYFQRFFDSELLIGLKFLKIQLIDKKKFKFIHPNHPHQLKFYQDLLFLQPFYFKETFQSSVNLILYDKLVNYENFWQSFANENFGLINVQFLEEDLMSLLLNHVWAQQQLSFEEQMYIENLDVAISGMGGAVLQEDSGDSPNDEFEINWDWYFLNWDLLHELYFYINDLYKERDFRDSELHYSYYLFIFTVSFIFWGLCKMQRFATYDSDAFAALIPLYRSSRYSDIFRIYFYEYTQATARNQLLGHNFLGERRQMFNPPYSLADDIMRNWYMPQVWLYDEGLLPFYKWVEMLNVREDYTKTQSVLTSGLLGIRRSNKFFQKNSLAWLKYGRLHRQLNKDFVLQTKSENRFRTRQAAKIERFFHRQYLAESMRSMRKVREKKVKGFQFNKNLLYSHKLSYFEEQLKDFQRDLYLFSYNSLFDFTRPAIDDWKLNKKKDIYLKQNLFRFSREAYKEALKLFLFGPNLVDTLNKKKVSFIGLSDSERISFLKQFFRKTKGFRNNRRFKKMMRRMYLSPKLNDPFYLESVLIRLFMNRAKRSSSYFDQMPPYVIVKNVPVDPDFETVNKLRTVLNNQSFHGFLLNNKFFNAFNREINIANETNIEAFSKGLYGTLLRNYVQYRYNTRSNLLRGIYRMPLVVSFLEGYADNERYFLLKKMNVSNYLFRLVRDFIGEDFIHYNYPHAISRREAYIANDSVFKWYESIYKNPYRYSSNYFADNNKNIIFQSNKHPGGYNREKIYRYLYSLGLYSQWEVFLRAFSQDFDFTDDYYLPWHMWFEVSELVPYWSSFYLTENFLGNVIEKNVGSEVPTLFNVLKEIRNSSKVNMSRLVYSHLTSNEQNHNVIGRGNPSDYPSTKLVSRMFGNWFVESIFLSLRKYSPRNKIHFSEETWRDNANIGYKKHKLTLFNFIPGQYLPFKLASIRLFDSAFESKRSPINYNSVYRDFRSSHYKDFHNEGFFNLARRYMDYHLGENSFNRRLHFGSHLKLPFNQLYNLDDIATPGSTQHRWYLGTLSDDIMSDEKRYLMHNPSVLWPYILRTAQDLPVGDMPDILISLYGGLINTNKAHAFGHVFYDERIKRNVNSDFFGDFGYEDLSYPPEEDSLGLVNLTTAVKFMVYPFFAIYNYLCDNLLTSKLDSVIRPWGGHLSLRPQFFREFHKFVVTDDKTYNKAYSELFNKHLPSDFYDNSAFVFNFTGRTRRGGKNYIFSLFHNYYYRKFIRLLYDKEEPKIRRDSMSYLYSTRLFYFPYSIFFGNPFAQAGYGALSMVLVYLFLYYLIWVPWMYFFFAINNYFDVDYGKEDIPSDEIQQDLEDQDKEELEEYSLNKVEREPLDTSQRHVISAHHVEVSDIVLDYYDHLKFDYTSLIESPYFFHLDASQVSFYGNSLFAISKNEYFDLINVQVFDGSLSYDLLDVMETTETSYILDGFRQPNPYYRSYYTEFLSLLTGLELGEGDLREEYLDLLVDSKFHNLYSSPKAFLKSTENSGYLTDGFVYYNNQVLEKKKPKEELKTHEQTLYELGRFTYNDPLKLGSLRNNLWMSTKLLMQGFQFLGIESSIYENTDKWMYLLHQEQTDCHTIYFDELLNYYPFGIFGVSERAKLNTRMQYKNGEMLLPIYCRFFRCENSYSFKDMHNLNDIFVDLLNQIGGLFLKKKNKPPKLKSLDSISRFVSIQDTMLVQPVNFEGMVSTEMLFGMLFLFKQYIQEISSIVTTTNINDYIIQRHSFELNELYSWDLLGDLQDECAYTWSDWLFFFEESTDWVMSLDFTEQVEIPEDFVPEIEDLQKIWDEEAEDEVAYFKSRPGIKKSLMDYENQEREEMEFIGYDKESINMYFKELRRKPLWLYNDMIEALVLVIDEDELQREEPYFPDSDTIFSNYFIKYQSTAFVAHSSLTNSLFIRFFFTKKTYTNNYHINNLFHDVFLQFICFQFIDLPSILDPFSRLGTESYGIEHRFNEISTYQNNLYYNYYGNKVNLYHRRVTQNTALLTTVVEKDLAFRFPSIFAYIILFFVLVVYFFFLF